MKKSIDIETMLFIPFREAILNLRKCRRKYGAFSEMTSFHAGEASAYNDICKNLGLSSAYDKWAYEHRNEVKEDAQT